MTSADRGLGLLLAALVVLSVVPAASAGPAGSHAQQATPTDGNETLDPADAIYVRDDGSAVLVYNGTGDDGEEYAQDEEYEEDEYEDDEYEDDGGFTYEDTPDTPSDIEYGADISSNLVYLLVSDPVEEETEFDGQASVLLTESNVSGNGRLSVDRPESLSTLSFQLAGETTDENAASNMTLDATFDSEDTSSDDRFTSASTTGNVTVTGSNYSAESDFDMQFEGSAADTDPESFSFVLTEDDGDYTVDMERNTTLSSYEVEDWSTREQARTTVEEQFATTASEYNGSANVTIERYEFSRESRENARLDIAYTVEYTGVEAAVTEALAENVSQSETVEMDDERVEQLTTQMQNLTIQRVATSYEVDAESASASFEADIRNYDDVVLAAADIAEAAETDEFDADGLENLDDLQTQIEAQQAASLRQETTWSATVSQPSTEEVSMTAEVNYTTENWDAYVTELNDRGIETYNTTYAASATTTDDDRLNATGSLTVDGDLFAEASTQVLNASEDDEDQPYIVSFLRADFQRGQVNVSADDEAVRIEMGAQFRNLSAFRDALAENGTVPAGLTSIVGRTDDGTTTTYVTVEDAVGANATESEVRDLSYVDEETEVYLPGEWDREFPSMDTERAASFLGTDLAASNGSTVTPSGGAGPGFGPGVALLALAGAALLAGRRA